MIEYASNPEFNLQFIEQKLANIPKETEEMSLKVFKYTNEDYE